MFDSLKNLGSMASLMSRAKEMQDRMKTLQEELAATQTSADDGEGRVTAIVSGKLELIKVRFDKSRIDPNDLETLEDLIVRAVSAAQHKAGAMIQQRMQQLAGEMGLPPGMLPQ